MTFLETGSFVLKYFARIMHQSVYFYPRFEQLQTHVRSNTLYTICRLPLVREGSCRKGSTYLDSIECSDCIHLREVLGIEESVRGEESACNSMM